MTTFTTRNVPLVEATDPADIAARVNPVAQLQHDRPGVSALTTTQRNALTGAELWDGRLILNTTTDRLNRYDLGTTTWVAVADLSEIAALLATTGTPATNGTAARGVSTSAARADHVHAESTYPWTDLYSGPDSYNYAVPVGAAAAIAGGGPYNVTVATGRTLEIVVQLPRLELAAAGGLQAWIRATNVSSGYWTNNTAVVLDTNGFLHHTIVGTGAAIAISVFAFRIGNGGSVRGIAGQQGPRIKYRIA